MRSSLCVLFAVVFVASSLLIAFENSDSKGEGSGTGTVSGSTFASLAGGETVEFKGEYPIPRVVGVGGMITVLRPDGAVGSPFPYWEAAHLINGTADPVLFYQTLEIYDNSNSLVDSYIVLEVVAPLTGVRTWMVSKTLDLTEGLYYVVGELGYVDNAGTDIPLDFAWENFSITGM